VGAIFKITTLLGTPLHVSEGVHHVTAMITRSRRLSWRCQVVTFADSPYLNA